MVSSIEELIESVFPNIITNFQDYDWLSQRAILAPRNEDVNYLNYEIQRKLPGDAITYTSIDSVTDEFESANYPIEFLNSLEPSGLPPHILTLKIGSTIMILRNIDPPFLCNGTRVVITNLRYNLIVATIIYGKFRGKKVLIPRIPMITVDLSIKFKRVQFPVKLAFAITINKSQGQSLQTVGLNLEKPCFSHGQLYVACSRVGNPKNLYIYTPNNMTKNIVYPIVLN